MSAVYDEENQSWSEDEQNTTNEIGDLNIEADRVIAMNPTGIIENFDNKKYQCNGDQCVILGNDNENKSNSYSKYIIYFVIFLALCALAYFFYKKYSNCDS